MYHAQFSDQRILDHRIFQSCAHLPECHIRRDGFGIVDQSLGHPDLPIIEPRLLFMGHLKNLVYATSLESDEDLVARIFEAAARVREIPGIFERIRQSLQRRSQACITIGECSFEQLL
ncbi:uncharacterized protein TNCV_144261 [Trichonephila clavipes]|nr:uncharacterized protein TNCV_144261 [Trichonephila clavipes]